MKLNADIVFGALKQRYPVRMMGTRITEMTISRPELYLDNEVEFLHSDDGSISLLIKNVIL